MVEIVKGGARGYRHMANAKWPFKNMEVHDMVAYPLAEGAVARARAHTYGCLSNKKFASKTIGEEIHIWRVA